MGACSSKSDGADTYDHTPFQESAEQSPVQDLKEDDVSNPFAQKSFGSLVK